LTKQLRAGAICGFVRRAKSAAADRRWKLIDRPARRVIGGLDFLQPGQSYDDDWKKYWAA
jgi:hypothetical protein